MNIVMEQARPAHVQEILKNLREHDKPLFAAIPDPAQALNDAIRKSSQGYAASLDGEVVALWAADVRTILADAVFLWMVTTRVVERHPIVLVRYATGIIKNILAEYGMIEGTVVTGNTVAIKWVTWLGAELVETPTPGVLEFRLRQSSHRRWRV